MKPTADLAFAGDGNFLCGECCGFCKAKNECRARAEANLKLAQHDFKLPPLLTDTEIEVILSEVDELVSWASDIKEYALQQALSGKEWTGFKIVEGRSNRRYSNEATVIDAVEKAGFDRMRKSCSALYQAYRNYSLDCNEYVRSTADFYFALEKAGFERLTLNRKRYFKGLKIHEDNGAEEDFLQ